MTPNRFRCRQTPARLARLTIAAAPGEPTGYPLLTPAEPAYTARTHAHPALLPLTAP